MIIAIDGSAASGKGTLAKRLATHFGLSHLDTGALYRAVGLKLLNAGQDPKNIYEDQCVKSCIELDITLTTSPLIRSEKVADGVCGRRHARGSGGPVGFATPICRRPAKPEWGNFRRP
jgi:cytidylate kinase